MKSKMTILCLILAPSFAMAQQYQARAVVTSVTPIVENIIVSQNCRDVYVQQQQQQNVGGQVLGAVIGGVIGSRFGGGNGRLIATGAGAAAGAMIGGGQQQSSMQMQHICSPVIEQRQTANAYVANYNGARVTGFTYRPLQIGDTVYVNVGQTVTPAE